MSPASVRHRREDVGGLDLHWVEEGSGEPVVMLHGFPEFWYSWRYQIPFLAEAGYRAVAPDMRGYNASGRPRAVAEYGVDAVADDILGLLDVLGGEPVSLVGHDWGAVVAFRVAARAPEKVRRLVVVNGPHPMAMRRELRDPRQLLRSWYVFLFQIPGLAEWIFRMHDYELVERVLRRDIRRESVLRETDFMRYAEAVSRPGALRAMLNYYRAAFRAELSRLVPGSRRRLPSSRSWRVEVPTLLVWGERDRYLGPGLTEDLDRWIPDLLVERIARAGHFAHVEAHERVNRLLAWFLGDQEAGEA